MRLAIFVLALAVGCSVPIGTLRVATLEPLAPGTRLVSRGRRVGEECRWWLFGVPFGLPRMQHAMAAAMAPVHGVAMRDVEIWSVHPFYGPLAGRHCYRVEGEVLAPSEGASP